MYKLDKAFFPVAPVEVEARPLTGDVRLLRLADYLETVLARQFDMSTWGNDEDPECGFSGCAIGWACEGKLFAGLERRPNSSPTYGGKIGHDALDLLFDLPASGTDSLHLFGTRNKGDTPRDVSARIREFVAARSAP